MKDTAIDDNHLNNFDHIQQIVRNFNACPIALCSFGDPAPQTVDLPVQLFWSSLITTCRDKITTESERPTRRTLIIIGIHTHRLPCHYDWWLWTDERATDSRRESFPGCSVPSTHNHKGHSHRQGRAEQRETDKRKCNQPKSTEIAPNLSATRSPSEFVVNRFLFPSHQSQSMHEIMIENFIIPRLVILWIIRQVDYRPKMELKKWIYLSIINSSCFTEIWLQDLHRPQTILWSKIKPSNLLRLHNST